MKPQPRAVLGFGVQHAEMFVQSFRCLGSSVNDPVFPNHGMVSSSMPSLAKRALQASCENFCAMRIGTLTKLPQKPAVMACSRSPAWLLVMGRHPNEGCSDAENPCMLQIELDVLNQPWAC